jgi:hypothetical protein
LGQTRLRGAVADLTLLVLLPDAFGLSPRSEDLGDLPCHPPQTF